MTEVISIKSHPSVISGLNIHDFIIVNYAREVNIS